MYLLSATAGIIIVIITLMHFVKRNVKKVNSDGKCVLITGCDSGVGLSLAIFSNFLGFHVIATCLDTSSSGAQLMVEKYPMILVLQMDVTRSDDVRKTRELVETYLIQTKSQLWGLINNAGVLIYGQFDWQTESQIINQVQVNLIGVMRVTKAFIPLIRNARGRIINITSANGHWCLPGLSVYCATKHGIEGFSNALRVDMIPWNVKVILLNPGNLPQSTKLLLQQSAHAEKMSNKMCEDDEKLYIDYFNHFQDYLKKNFSSAATEPLVDAGLHTVFESAILDPAPNNYYNNISMGFQIYVSIFKVLPAKYADKLSLFVWGKSVGYDLI